ncbi:MAG: hypothetical protein AVDCRST_MAG54-2415, partial [uncultured Actinomycetospora sp.]
SPGGSTGAGTEDPAGPVVTTGGSAASTGLGAPSPGVPGTAAARARASTVAGSGSPPAPATPQRSTPNTARATASARDRRRQ